MANAVQSLAKKADRVVIATDFDPEGELIGVEDYHAASLSVEEVRERGVAAVDRAEQVQFDQAW